MKLRDLIIAGFFSLTTLQGDYFKQYLVSENERVVSSLKLNIDNDERFIAFKQLEDGLDDLQHLAATNMYEESYAFFPKTNLWVELGYDESFLRRGKSLTASIRIDVKLLDKLVEKYGFAKVYHTHPDIAPSGEIKEERAKKISSDYLVTQKSLCRLLGGRRKSQPSRSDCLVLLHDLNRYDESVSNSEFFVASSQHIASYDVLNVVDRDNLFDSLNNIKSGDTTIVYGPNLKVSVWNR